MSCSILITPYRLLPLYLQLILWHAGFACKLTKEPSGHRLRSLLLGSISVALTKSPDVTWYLDYVNKQYLIIYTRIAK